MSNLTIKQAQRLAQSWCDSNLYDDCAGGWAIELAPKLVGQRQAIIDLLLTAFPWLTPSRFEGRWADVFFDGEVASTVGTLKLRSVASLRFVEDGNPPYVDFYIYPNVFVTGTVAEEGHESVYDEDAASENREKLNQSLKALEEAVGGRIIDAITDQFEEIDHYGIPADAQTVYT